MPDECGCIQVRKARVRRVVALNSRHSPDLSRRLPLYFHLASGLGDMNSSQASMDCVATTMDMCFTAVRSAIVTRAHNCTAKLSLVFVTDMHALLMRLTLLRRTLPIVLLALGVLYAAQFFEPTALMQPVTSLLYLASHR